MTWVAKESVKDFPIGILTEWGRYNIIEKEGDDRGADPSRSRSTQLSYLFTVRYKRKFDPLPRQAYMSTNTRLSSWIHYSEIA